jgi:hypothetical protein
MSYEELKKRVASLKEVERADVKSRKEEAVKEAAEVYRCVSHTEGGLCSMGFKVMLVR